LLPKLLALQGDELNIAHTAAVVYLRSGKLDRADSILTDMIEWLPEGSPTWFSVRYNLAELKFRRGKLEPAKRELSELLRRPECPASVDLEAGSLLAKIELAEERQKVNGGE
jgi:hypothetical protein